VAGRINFVGMGSELTFYLLIFAGPIVGAERGAKVMIEIGGYGSLGRQSNEAVFRVIDSKSMILQYLFWLQYEAGFVARNFLSGNSGIYVSS